MEFGLVMCWLNLGCHQFFQPPYCCSAAKWMKFKLQVMASFSAKLREELLRERERGAALEVQLALAEVSALKVKRRGWGRQKDALYSEQTDHNDRPSSFKKQSST